MKIYDCHLHIEKGLDNYDLEIEGGNVIYNSIENYKLFSQKHPEYSASLIFDYKNNLNFVLEEARKNRLSALKIHSRIQQISINDYEYLFEALDRDKTEIPIIYDAFYFGSELDFQPSLYWLVELIKRYPKRKIIVAHSGGYEVLKYFFHLRPFGNVYYDLSFSLQYLSDSSIFMDIKKLIKYTDKTKIFFGSDYPYASPLFQKNSLVKIFTEIGLNNKDQQLILSKNARDVFNIAI